MDKNNFDNPEIESWVMPEGHIQCDALQSLELSVSDFIKGSKRAYILEI
jgi:hypothetical protein